MFAVHAIGLKSNDIECARLVFAHLEDTFCLPSNTDAWGMASCVDQCVLFSKGPLANGVPSLGQISQKSLGDCVLWQFRTDSDLRPNKAGAENSNLGPFRYKNLAATVVGGPQTPDEANGNREFLLRTMPTFLSRALVGYSEAEALFFGVAAEMYCAGIMDCSVPDLRSSVGSVLKVLNSLPVKTPRSIELTNGVDIVHVSFDQTSTVLMVNDIEHLVQRENNVDSKYQTQRLNSFRGNFSFSNVALGRRKKIKGPDWSEIITMPKNSSFFLGQDMNIEKISI